MTSLHGQVAAVVGPTSDIGRALCFRLVAAGARLGLLGRDAGGLDLLAKTLDTMSSARAYPMDLASEASLVGAADQLLRNFGRVDVLIHTAGAFAMGPTDNAPLAELDLQYRTNVRGPYRLTQALLPSLRASRGQIIFMNSTVGLAARAGVGQYASTQHALRAIADALRDEVNADGVRVLSLFLGRTATARQRRIFRLEGRAYSPELLIQPDDVAEMVLAAISLARTAEVTEIRMRPLVKSY